MSLGELLQQRWEVCNTFLHKGNVWHDLQCDYTTVSSILHGTLLIALRFSIENTMKPSSAYTLWCHLAFIWPCLHLKPSFLICLTPFKGCIILSHHILFPWRQIKDSIYSLILTNILFCENDFLCKIDLQERNFVFISAEEFNMRATADVQGSLPLGISAWPAGERRVTGE